MSQTRLQAVDDLFQFSLYLSGDILQVRIAYRLHRSNRVDGGNFKAAVIKRLHDDIAGQHCSDLVFLLQRLMGKRRIARTEDAIGFEIDIQLFLGWLSHQCPLAPQNIHFLMRGSPFR